VAPRIALRSLRLFNDEELEAIIEAAHARGVKVAAHANDNASILSLASLGVDSVEHGFAMDDKTLESLRAAKVTWNPTLAAYYSHPASGDRWKQAQDTFSRALKMDGLRISCGGDTGVFNHGDNALELKLMFRAGASWSRVLQAATLGGWQCIRGLDWEGPNGKSRLERIHLLKEDRRVVGENDMPFGVIRKGFAADLIAICESVPDNFERAISPSSVTFVMKGGIVYKNKGIPALEA